MPRPWKHPKTGVYWFRKEVPAALREKVGKRELKWTLATKERAEALTKYPAALDRAERMLAAAKGGFKLTAEQAAGMARRWLEAQLEQGNDLLTEVVLDIALALEQMLRVAGYEVVGMAATADAAISSIRELQPDLALLDIRLRGAGDGIDVATAIGNVNGTGVIFTTSESFAAVLKRAEALMPLGWVAKPYTSERILEAVKAGMAKVGARKGH